MDRKGREMRLGRVEEMERRIEELCRVLSECGNGDKKDGVRSRLSNG